MSIDLKGYTPKEYFKLHGTLPASVIEVMLDYEEALSNIKNYMEGDVPDTIKLEQVEWYEEFESGLSSLETELTVILNKDCDAMQQFQSFQKDVSEFKKSLEHRFGVLAQIQTKIGEFTCNI